MADLNYKVTVDTANAQKSLSGLRTALGGLAAAFSIRAIVQFGDSITNLQNKLRTISTSSEDVARQFAAIGQIADRNRTSLTATGDLYFKIARSLDVLNISQRDAAVLTDSISKGLTLSGASAEGAASAIYQLGQAFGANVLRGEELNAVLENAPVLTTILADSLGVTVGQLRKLGEQGKLTGQVVAQAFINANAQLTDSFAKTVPTVAQSLERLRTNLGTLFVNIGGGEALGTLAEAVGEVANAMRPLGEFIQRNGEELAALAKITATVIIAFTLFTKATRVVQAAQSALIAIMGTTGKGLALTAVLFGGAKRAADNFSKALGLTVVAGAKLSRIGYLIAGIGAALRTVLRFAGVAGIILALGQAIDFVVEKLSGFSILDWVVGKFRELGQWLGITSKEQEATAQATTDATAALNNQAQATNSVIKATADQVNAVRQLTQAYRDTVTQQEDSLRINNQLIGAGELQRNLVENLRTSYQNYLNQRKAIEQEIQELTAKGDAQEMAKIPLLTQALADLEARYKINLQTVRDLTLEQERLNQARNLELFAISQQQSNADALLKIQREIADLGLSEIEKKYRDIDRAAEDSARAAIRAEEQRRGGIALSQGEIDRYYEAAKRGNEELKRQTRELFERSRSFSSGWNKAFREYADNATNAARRAEDLFRKATQGMEDAIVNFAKTGKFEWKNFVNMMVEELLRAQIQQLFAQIFNAGRPGAATGGGGGGSILGTVLGALGGGQSASSSSGGSGGGSVLGSIGSWLNKNIFGGFFANGGMLPAGKIGVVGERGPELISGPANITPMAGGTVNYYIQAVDAPSFQALVARDPGFIHAVAMQGARSMPAGRR
jgi:lambda family phage tail tape measure protein